MHQILGGEKTNTRRLFDDKDLKVGDELELIESGTNKVFAHAIITECIEKKMGEVMESEIVGYYDSIPDMYKVLGNHYPDKTVGPETLIKFIEFKLK